MPIGTSDGYQYDDEWQMVAHQMGAIDVAPIEAKPVTDQYDTQLSTDEQKKYDSMFGPDASQDYDMRGWMKANPDVNPHQNGEHYTDEFKKPNHMTFSNQSIYNGKDGNDGGVWGTDADGKDTFTPGSTNLQNHSFSEMQDYFKRVEPDVQLLEPQPATVGVPQGPDPALGK